MSTITVPPGTQHLPWADAVAECSRGLTISDAAAVTIAAAFQSPGTCGSAFAQLASTGSVELEALVSDLAAVSRDAAAVNDEPTAILMAYLTGWMFDRATTRH